MDIDIETQQSNDQKCFEVSKAITRLLRHDQSVPRGIDGASTTMAKGGGAKKRFQYCVPNSPNQFLYLRAIQELQEKVLLILHCISDSERIYRVSPPRRERERIEFLNKKWINSRRNKPQKRKTSSLLHNSEPAGGRIWLGRNSLRSDKTKDRATREYLETPSKYSILVQLGVCQRERSAILPNAVTCSRSLQHTACSLH